MTLISRLEQATEGSRELDAEIAKIKFGADAVRMGGAGWPEGAIIVPCYPGWQIMPAYTRSLDAAMSLSEGRVWKIISEWTPKRSYAFVWNGDGTSTGHESDASTPAIALCIASLKAAGYE